MSQIKAWVKDCEENHGHTCKPPDPAYLPTRLIDVTGDTLCLRESTPGEQGCYAALSYCWGGPQVFATGSATLSARLESFSLAELPKTLQDAVTVTRNLDIPYLWVDSLCIIQDSEADRAHETSRMAQIYKSAYVTICAARSDSADSGFLGDLAEPSTGLWPNLFPLHFQIPSREATTVKEAYELPPRARGTLQLLYEEKNFLRFTSDPVAQRAWCLQERVLSPRFLSYGRWPTWRCAAGVKSDGGAYEDRPDQESRITELLLKLPSAAPPAAVADLFTTSQLHSGWITLLTDYTRRELTVSSDRLPALGGIATEMRRVTGVQYLAGLWANNLLYDAMWYVDGREWLNRPNKWRAPSWSWASVDMPVSYMITPDAIPLATVLGCEVTPAVEGSWFGEVGSGTLTIDGPFRKLDRADVLELFRGQDMAPAPPKSNNGLDWNRLILEHIMNQSKNSTTDDEVQATLPEAVFGLVMYSRGWLEKHEVRIDGPCYSGLLLREIEGEEGKYERIGTFMNEDATWANQKKRPWDKKTVVLL